MSDEKETNNEAVYEDLVAAYITLELLKDSTVRNFQFEVNPSSIGIKIEDNYGKEEKLVLQLELDLDAKKFDITQYREAFNNLQSEIQDNYKFILFTNATFINSGMKPGPKSFKTSFFNTENTFQFENDQKDDKFLEKFYLFLGQKNSNELRKAIIHIFKKDYFSTKTTALSYINFFGQKCEIDRDTVILQLMDLLLEDVLIPITLSDGNKSVKYQLVEKVLEKFDINLVQTDVDTFKTYGVSAYLDEEEKNIIEEEAKKYRFIHKDHVDVEIPMLRCLIGKPLFVAVEQRTYPLIKLAHTLQRLRINFVLVGKEIEQSFEPSRVFHNLDNLKHLDSSLYEEVAEAFSVSLQGREAKTIKTLTSDFLVDLDKFIGANELFRSLDNDLLIGQKIDPLPAPYMERFLRRSYNIENEDLRSICQQNEERVTIVHCGALSQHFKSFLEEQQLGVQAIDIRNHIPHTYYKKPTLILTSEENCANKEDCYYHLKLDNNNNVQWKTRTLRLDTPRIFDRKLVIVSDNLGSGKTTIKNYLAKNCPLNYWVVDVDPKEASKYLDHSSTTERCLKSVDVDSNATTEDPIEEGINLNYFPTTEDFLKSCHPGNNEIDSDVMDSLMRKGKLMFFLDGLNELPLDRIYSILEKVNYLLMEGHKCWIFCTKRLNHLISAYCGNAAILEIAGLKKEQQKELLKKQIQDIPIYEDVLKSPFYLLIIADIIKKEVNIGQLYDTFIEKTLERSCPNLQLSNDGYILRQMIMMGKKSYVEKYQIAALKTCLRPSDFEMLKVNNQRIFLDDDTDIMDILVRAKEDGTYVFGHYSFAQYFAAKWLNENFEHISFQKRRFLYKPEYVGIRHFFDLMLAENCPLHLAIQERNLSKVRCLAKKHRNDVDKGGRTPLHIASSIGPKQSHRFISDEEEKILKCLLDVEAGDILKEDTLYKWNCFQYADASLSLPFLEELSKKEEVDMMYLKNFQNLPLLIEACGKFGYSEVLSKATEWAERAQSVEDTDITIEEIQVPLLETEQFPTELCEKKSKAML